MDGSDVNAIVEFCLLSDFVYDRLSLRHVAGTADLWTEGELSRYLTPKLQLTDRLKLH